MNIVLLGAQGAGKGMVAEHLSNKYGFFHISTGELFREEISKQTDFGAELASYMNKGMLVPDEIVFRVLEKALKNKTNCVIDGFPRNIVQAQKLTNLIDVDLVIFVSAPKYLLIDRLSSRRFCPICKGNYNLLNFNGNLCTNCNQPLLQRDDDVPDIISKRLEIFYKNIEPILNYYKNKNVLQTLENSGELSETYQKLEKIIKCYM